MCIQAISSWGLKLAAIGVLTAGLVTANIYFEINCPKVNRVAISSEKIPPEAEINILQISDFHNWHPNDRHQDLLQKIKKISPDLIVITGDLIDRKTNNFDNVFALVKELVQINPHTFFICGNHEWANSQTKLFLDGLSNRGVQIINNKHVVWSRNHISINICGVDDPSKERANLEMATQDINTEIFTLLLAHAPEIVAEKTITRTDLVLCGHTHGGQVRLPFAGAIIVPGQGFFPLVR